MGKRINVILPEATLKTIDRISKPGERSQFIDQAVRHFVASRSAESIRARLEQTAVRDRDLDREVAAEWLAADQESWEQVEPDRKSATRDGAKSTSRRSIQR